MADRVALCSRRKKFPPNTTVKRLINKSGRTVKPPKTMTIKPSIWQDILDEDNEFENYVRKEKEKNLPDFETAYSYLEQEVLPHVIPAFEKMCAITLKLNVLSEEVRFFSFLDLLAEILHNTNPAHSGRQLEWLSIHLVYGDIYRPYYPFFWFLSEDEAAVMIQALIRGFLIRCKYDLEAMKEERRKIKAGIEKQQRCYNALKDDIETIFADPSQN